MSDRGDLYEDMIPPHAPGDPRQQRDIDAEAAAKAKAAEKAKAAAVKPVSPVVESTPAK